MTEEVQPTGLGQIFGIVGGTWLVLTGLTLGFEWITGWDVSDIFIRFALLMAALAEIVALLFEAQEAYWRREARLR